MAAHTRVAVGYNIQVAVDAKNEMIVGQAVTTQVVDMGLLKQMAEPGARNPRRRDDRCRRRPGLFQNRGHRGLRAAGLTPHVPRPQRGPDVANGFSRKDEFRYEAELDSYICPAGRELKPIRRGRLRDLQKVDYAIAEACRDSSLRPRCTNADYRAVARRERGRARPHGGALA